MCLQWSGDINSVSSGSGDIKFMKETNTVKILFLFKIKNMLKTLYLE